MQAASKPIPRTSPAGYLFASAALLLFAPFLSRRLSPELIFLFAAAVCLLVVRLVRRHLGLFDWFHPLTLFTAHFFLMFVANGVVILIGISHILTTVYGPAPDTVFDLVNLATLYATAFLLAVFGGFLYRAPRHSASSFSSSPSSTPNDSWKRSSLVQLRLAAWLALAASYLGCFILVFLFGGLSQILTDPTAVIESRGAFWPFLLVWANLWSLGVFYLSWIKSRDRRDLTAILLTVPTFLFEFLSGGTKTALLLPVILILILRHFLVRRLTWRFLPWLAAFTLLLFILGYSYRFVGSGDLKSGVSAYTDDKSLVFATFFGRFYGTDSFMLVLDQVQQGYPLQYGSTFSELLYFYVPRVFWPAKPESYSLQFGREFLGADPGAGETFFTPSLPGELYLNFGLFGLFFGGFFLGRAIRLFCRVFLDHLPLSPRHILAYAVLVPLVALLVAGPVSTVVEFILMRCACFAFLYWIASGLVTTAPARAPEPFPAG